MRKFCNSVYECLVVYRRAIVLGLHILLAAAAFSLAFMLRFDFGPMPERIVMIWFASLPVAILFKIIALHYFGATTGLWRYVGMSDLVSILKACTASTVCFVLAVVIFYGHGFPRSVYVIDYVLTLVAFGGVRFAIRLGRESLRPAIRRSSGKRTLIIGAGDAGDIALRSLMKDYMGVYQVVGFLDDDPRKRHMQIHGVPILGAISDAAKFVREFEITEVLIAISAAGRPFIRSIVESCAGHNVNFRIMPAIRDLMTGRFEVEKIRKVQLEDLLGRDPIQLDKNVVRQDLAGKRVLVTGAGGSIGSELSRQIAGFGPEHLVLLDVAETPLFEIHRELSERYPDLHISAVLADVKHINEVEDVFAVHRPERVYHAAAYKHVPMMQAHPVHAVRNNIIGTHNVAATAAAHGTERFVMISTDKAVRPSSVMGATKRLCELVVAHMNHGTTRFASVRFGNVLGSNGSVIPIFEKQIAAGGPVRVTHPEMTRYFMTIPEAVELVLQAGTMASGNDVFVLEMGTPVKIMDLARNMIELSGMVAGQDIQIETTGLRPGEKLHEELVSYGESLDPTGIPKVNRLRSTLASRVYPKFGKHLATLAAACKTNKEHEITALLWEAIAQDQKYGEAAGED